MAAARLYLRRGIPTGSGGFGRGRRGSYSGGSSRRRGGFGSGRGEERGGGGVFKEGGAALGKGQGAAATSETRGGGGLRLGLQEGDEARGWAVSWVSAQSARFASFF